MKKVFAILAILVIVAGMVFAATGDSESHTITLKTKVTGDDPIFALAATYNNSATATNSDGVAFEKDASYAGASQISVLDLSKNDVEVTFVAKLINEAKSNDAYTVSFVPGPFQVKKLDASNNRIAAKVYPANAEGSVIGQNSVGYTLGALQVGTDAADAKQIKYTNSLTFTGAKVADVNNVLATYVVKYTKDADIAANTADEPFYFADCVLTITMN